MAFSFYCDDCDQRFWLDMEEGETEEEFVKRADITRQEPCPICGRVCEPCTTESYANG